MNVGSEMNHQLKKLVNGYVKVNPVGVETSLTQSFYEKMLGTMDRIKV